jgi:hypothetical protein
MEPTEGFTCKQKAAKAVSLARDVSWMCAGTSSQSKAEAMYGWMQGAKKKGLFISASTRLAHFHSTFIFFLTTTNRFNISLNSKSTTYYFYEPNWQDMDFFLLHPCPAASPKKQCITNPK